MPCPEPLDLVLQCHPVRLAAAGAAIHLPAELFKAPLPLMALRLDTVVQLPALCLQHPQVLLCGPTARALPSIHAELQQAFLKVGPLNRGEHEEEALATVISAGSIRLRVLAMAPGRGLHAACPPGRQANQQGSHVAAFMRVLLRPAPEPCLCPCQTLAASSTLQNSPRNLALAAPATEAAERREPHLRPHDPGLQVLRKALTVEPQPIALSVEERDDALLADAQALLRALCPRVEHQGLEGRMEPEMVLSLFPRLNQGSACAGQQSCRLLRPGFLLKPPFFLLSLQRLLPFLTPSPQVLPCMAMPPSVPGQEQQLLEPPAVLCLKAAHCRFQPRLRGGVCGCNSAPLSLKGAAADVHRCCTPG
mmetsp:Transcript_61693/g.198772  ORF Transcript_61693/g.198772 Transcript_61693/m.198772 type:complete len:364 (+) Transcript_61693:1064-2155(+)